MSDIILLHYNNYFNRKAMHPGNSATNTISQYTALDSNYVRVSGVNFNPADGVDTSLVLGKGEIPTSGKELDTFDYLITCEVGDTDPAVTSR